MHYQTKIVILTAVLLPALAIAQSHLPLTEQTPATSRADDEAATTYAVKSADASAADIAPHVDPNQPPFKMVQLLDEVPFRRIDQWRHRTPIGSATEKLLNTQASGAQAGPLLPTLGATANLSWKRYLDSFTHPIPDTFEKKIESK